MPYQSATNLVVLTGRLTRDPELRSTKGDHVVATIGLAVRSAARGEDDSQSADFFDVTVWNGLAETCAQHLSKGRLVSITGRLEPQRWTAADGSKRRAVAIVANSVEFLDRPQRDTDSTEQQPEEAPVAA
ncbi:MAG: single-stranded DNA-binding protein [Solirubrobacterales bacterium]